MPGLAHHYAALGLGSDASPDEVRNAWRLAVQRWHPDAMAREGRTLTGRDQGARMAAATEAHQVLYEPERRAAYDAVLDAAIDARLGACARGPLGGVLDRIVGVPPRKPVQGRNRRMKLAVPFADAFRGSGVVVALEVGETCAGCDGAGFGADGRPHVCDGCAGLGATLDRTRLRSHWVPCAACGQRGYCPAPPCATCVGRGYIVRGAKLEIPVPPGTTSGTVLRVQGAGEFDLDGAPPGDLLVEVSVTSDPLMTQRGHDLHLSRPVPVWLALAGGPLEVPTPHGGARVEVPAGVRDREVLRLKGWGVRSLEGSGDALVELVIEWPAHLGSEARKALRAWGTSLGVDAFPESARFEARHLVGSDS